MARVTKAQLRHVADNATKSQVEEILARYYCREAALILRREPELRFGRIDPDEISEYAIDVTEELLNTHAVGDLMFNVAVDYSKKPTKAR